MTPDKIIESDENKKYLKDAMEELKKEYCTVLKLLYFEDMSYAEAGYVMKKSTTQISNLAYRAKSALKKELENAGFVY